MKNIFDILRFLRLSKKQSSEDSLKIYGNFGLTVRENGKKTLRIEKRNQIVDGGRLTVLYLLRQSLLTPIQMNPNYAQLWSLSAGTNATPPAVSDTGLYDPQWTLAYGVSDAMIYVQTVPTYEILISVVMPTTDGIGITFQEAGLFTRGSLDDPSTLIPPLWESIPFRVLFARQIHPPVLKSGIMTLEYAWRIGITV